MRNNRLLIGMAAAAATMVALAGCVKDRESGMCPGSGKMPIVLKQVGVQSARGFEIEEGQLANGTEFSLTAYYYPGGEMQETGKSLYWEGMSIVDGAEVKTNQRAMLEVPYKVVSDKFVSQAEYPFYWPQGAGDKLRFYAYMPETSKVHPTADLIFAYGASPLDYCGITYSLPDSVADHHDLLVAGTEKLSPGGEVTLNFNHTLTRIDFFARRSDELAGKDVMIKKIVVRGALREARLSVDVDNPNLPFKWEGYGPENKKLIDLVLSSSGDSKVLKVLNLNGEHQTLMLADAGLGRHCAMAIPMNNGTFGKTLFNQMEVDVTATIDGVERAFTLPLAGTDPWAPGKKVTYLMTVSAGGIGWDYVVEDWIGTDPIEPELSNVVLEVSRTEATINEHNKARFWFKTNQPEVKLEVEGLNGHIIEIDWDEIAEDLTGGNPRNFKMWKDESTGLHHGYIDIETDRDKPRVGSTGNLGTFFINAGGLRRRITMHWENVPSDEMPLWRENPYVGAFWRHDEVGERLICGRLDEEHFHSWTAEVVYEDAHVVGFKDFVVLEKGKTLDERVWTNLEPGDPENYPVDFKEPENDSEINHYSIGGTGNIYFRIGLKRTIGPNEVRYARVNVRVTYQNGSGKDSDEYDIYVRQGEAADYLMRPEDVGKDGESWDSPSRPLAVKFSPYNLTAPAFNGKGSQEYRVDVGARGGTWTDYPSQAGAFFQWAHTNGVNAYNAAVPTGAPSVWGSTNTVEEYWGNLGETYESCPPGYRRPTDGSKDNTDAVTKNPHMSVSEMRQSLFIIPDKSIINYRVGYYADGFFDRRIINSANTTVSAGNSVVAYCGGLFFNTNNRASLFFPAAGSRIANGHLSSAGVTGKYWTSSAGDDKNAQALVFSTLVYSNSEETRHFALPVRCVKDE